MAAFSYLCGWRVEVCGRVVAVMETGRGGGGGG
jgi:hypothetical protein